MVMKTLPEDPGALAKEIMRLRKALSDASMGLEGVLRLRGFHVHSKEPQEDLLMPAKKHIDGFYRMMGRYSFRLFMRDVIKHQDSFDLDAVTKYATSGVTGDYMAYLADAGMIKAAPGGYALKKRPIKSFGVTLEWYVAEIFKREFGTEALWGVKFKRQEVGGDYDLIAKLDGELLYMEVKSSPPKQIYRSEVAGFLDRVEDLNPGISVFFLDTELRMKDKIVPMFEEELGTRLKNPPEVKRLEMELFRIWDRTFIINSRHSVLGNIEKVLAWYFRNRENPLKEWRQT